MTLPATNRAGGGGQAMVSILGDMIGGTAAAGMRRWVRLTGRRVARRNAPWLDCPMGPPGRIGAEFYASLAEREHLDIRPALDAGLLPDFDALSGLPPRWRAPG